MGRSRIFVCTACNRQCERQSGFTKHVRKCPAYASALQAHRGTEPRHQDSSVASLPYSHQPTLDTDEPTLSTHESSAPIIRISVEETCIENDIAASVEADDKNDYTPEDGNTRGLFELHPDLDAFALNTRQSGSLHEAGEEMLVECGDADGVASADGTRVTIASSRGRLSSTSASSQCEKRTYNEETNREAGARLYSARNPPPGERPGAGNTFSSDFDIAFAHWLVSERISSNAITRLLGDARMKPLVDQLSWRSSTALIEKLGLIGTTTSHGIGDWTKTEIEIERPSSSTGKVVYHLRHRKVEDAIRFLLGHKSFNDHLTYEPYRQWTTSQDVPQRIYSDMASCDWWWETQTRIANDRATVVPLIVATDKTQLTSHQGDLNVHAVYLTIGNLSAEVRNSNTRPGCVLLAMLPVVKEKQPGLRSQVYHECMQRIFNTTKRIADGEGMNVACADGWTRACFPVVAAMVVDHEEQVLITGVKSGVQCTMCTVNPDLREDLEIWAPWRTHKSTQKQHELQRRTRVKATDPEWVHDTNCFAFGHRYVNVHKTLMVDILHQLLNGVIKHTREWTYQLLEEKLPGSSSKRYKAAFAAAVKRKAETTLGSLDETISRVAVRDTIDRRFAIVPTYHDIRRFGVYSQKKQWTGKEHKSLLRQMLPVFTPLLQDIGATDAIRFIRALVDFTLLAMYKSHDDETLRYMTGALSRMNAFKNIFRPYRAKDKDGDGHFNFPKFHALTHYPDMIRWLGSATGLETGPFEHKHLDFVKNTFKLTNKKPGFEDQIMEHHRRRINLDAVFDTWTKARELTIAEKRERAEQPVQVTEAVDPHVFFGWPNRVVGRGRVAPSKWRTVAEAEKHLGSPLGKQFRQAVAVFVREARKTRDDNEGMKPCMYNPDLTEHDDTWIGDYEVQFHPSLRCWRHTEQDPNDPDATEAELIRCAPNWQGISGNERYDWMWVQEYFVSDDHTKGNAAALAFEGRLPARARLVVTVKDIAPRARESHGDAIDNEGSCRQWQHFFSKSEQPTYTGVFVDLFRPKHPSGLPDDVHGMTEITAIPPSPWRGLLRGRRIYALSHVHYGIHAVPINEDGVDQDFYINHTADFESYNFLWNPSWEEVESRAACVSRAARFTAVKNAELRRTINAQAEGDRRARIANCNRGQPTITGANKRRRERQD